MALQVKKRSRNDNPEKLEAIEEATKPSTKRCSVDLDTNIYKRLKFHLASKADEGITMRDVINELLDDFLPPL
ncbi:MAG: plasmid partition protein ParG [Cyanobacteria bacterium P01_H01_bin.74]